MTTGTPTTPRTYRTETGAEAGAGAAATVGTLVTAGPTGVGGVAGSIGVAGSMGSTGGNSVATIGGGSFASLRPTVKKLGGIIPRVVARKPAQPTMPRARKGR